MFQLCLVTPCEDEEEDDTEVGVVGVKMDRNVFKASEHIKIFTRREDETVLQFVLSVLAYEQFELLRLCFVVVAIVFVFSHMP